MSFVDKRLAQDLATRTNSMIVIEATSLLIINCLALLGDGFVFILAYRNRHRLTVTDVLIVALSSTDLLVAVTVMPLSHGVIIKGVWFYDQSLCRFQGFCIISFVSTSLSTLSVIAINRFYCVVKPNQYRTVFLTRNTIGFLIIAWIVTFSFSIPPLIFGADHYTIQPGKVLCVYPFEINTAYTVGLDVAFIGIQRLSCPFVYLFNHFHHNRETGCGGGRTTERGSKLSAPFYPPNHDIAQKTDHNTGNYMPYSLRQVFGFLYVPQDYEH